MCHYELFIYIISVLLTNKVESYTWGLPVDKVIDRNWWYSNIHIDQSGVSHWILYLCNNYIRFGATMTARSLSLSCASSLPVYFLSYGVFLVSFACANWVKYETGDPNERYTYGIWWNCSIDHGEHICHMYNTDTLEGSVQRISIKRGGISISDSKRHTCVQCTPSLETVRSKII